MTTTKLFFLFLISALSLFELRAAEILGGSIRYESLGNQKYTVIGVLNRNCSGTPLSIPVFKIEAGSLSYTLTASRTSIEDVTPRCSKTSSPCVPSNTTTNDGVEQHTFETTVDFSVAPYNQFYTQGQCEVMFSMAAFHRSYNLTTVSANQFYIEAMLNLCILGTSLSNSTSKNKTETAIKMCCNVPFAYNLGYSDPDIDSVIYSLETPKKSKDSFEQFLSPFSASIPMSPFCVPSGVSCTPLPNAKPPRGIWFDANTGDLVLTPTNCSEHAVISIKARDFRKINNKMELVGYTTTELNVEVVICSDNNPPTIPTSNKQTVCEGNKLCFTIQSKDARSLKQTTDDTTQLIWNNGIPGAVFAIVDPTAREKEAQFCWQTQLGDARDNPYSFTVTATDDFCPNPARTNKGFIVTVKPRATMYAKYTKQAGNKLVFEGVNGSSISNIYEWTIADTLYKTFNQKDSVSFKDTGTYIIKIVVNNYPRNCPTTYYDTVHLDGSITTAVHSLSVLNARIYPNPASQSITIDLPMNHGISDIKLWSSDGRLIYSGAYAITLDISAYSKGVYMLELIGEEQHQFLKVIKS